MEHNLKASSATQVKEKNNFDPKDYPPLIKQFWGNFVITEWLVMLIFLVTIGGWWILADLTYESEVFDAITFRYTFPDLTVLINNVFIYSAIVLGIFLPGRSKRLICDWLNRADKLNIKKTSEEGKRIGDILKGTQRHFRLIAVGTILFVIGMGAVWHSLKNLVSPSSPVSPFYDAWLQGIETREFADGPIPSILHTFIVMIGFGIATMYVIDMWYLIYAIRELSSMVSDDPVEREINPYHSDRMGGLKPYSTIAIRLATYNTIPYVMAIPFIMQYLTTSSLISQLISIGLIAAIFLGLGLIIWIMMSPLDRTLKRFKEKFDQKVYEAIENPRFGQALDMVLKDGTSPPPEDGVFFTATLSLWGVATNLRSSALDMDEVKRTLIKIAGPLAGFLAKVVFG